MTISTTTRRWSYTGDGTTTAFPYNNLIFSATDLQVYVGGVLQTGGYTVSGAGSGAGGNVTFTTAPAAATAVLIVSAIPATQPTHYAAAGVFPSAAVEGADDRTVSLVQQVVDAQSRAISLPVAEDGANAVLPPAATRANNFLSFDAAGNVSATVAVAGLADATAAAAAAETAATAADNAAAAANAAVAAVANGMRVRLTASITVYVDSVAGSDATADGTNAATPFKTPNAAWTSIMQKYDFNGNNPTLHLKGAGPYHLWAVDRPVGAHAVWVQGDGSATTVMQGTAGTPALLQQDFANVVLSGVTVNTDGSAGAYGWAAQQGCISDTGTDLVIGPALNGTALSISQGARFNNFGFTIGGSALCLINLNQAIWFNSGVIEIPTAVTLGGTGSACVIAGDRALFTGGPGMFAGAGLSGCLGVKYINNGATFDLAGADPNTVFPGHIDGNVPTQSDMFMTATAANVTGDGTAYTLIFPTGVTNKYGKFDPATGVFSGICDDEITFDLTLTLSGITSAHTQLVLTAQNSNGNVSSDLLNINPYAIAVGGNLTLSATTTQSFRGPATAGATPGDTAQFVLTVIGGAKTVSVTGTTVNAVNYTRVTARGSALANGGGSFV